MFKLGDPRTTRDPNAIITSETVTIDAPASLVWDVLLDMPQYGDWNPFVVECESTLEVGDPVKMKIKSYVNAEPEFFEHTEYICHFEPEKQIAWMIPHYDYWPYPARRDQYIKATGPKSCEYYTATEFRGPNGIHVMRFTGSWVKQAFDDTAHALKAHAEKLYKASQS